MIHLFKMNKLILKLKYSLIFILLNLSCSKEKNEQLKSLEPIAKYKLNFIEASGLSNYKKKDLFLSVSDNTNKIYVISNKGEVINILDFEGDDLEGIAYDSATSSIFVIEEKLKQIVRLDTNGIEIERYPIDISNSEIKHGPEGISIDPANNQIYIVNEKKPGKLLVMSFTGEILNQYDLSFAKDYASIFFNHRDNKLWILSDESKTLSKCDLSGNELETWNTGIRKGEGLIVDSENSLVYIVSDTDSYLYQFNYY